MGCVFSRQNYEENPKIFHVWNVDGEGRPLRPGHIEVTETQLVFHQGARQGVVVRWPLTSLRRYGFDAELFSFECGRRCATGAGVYAFRCRRATRLFATLQEAINSSTAVTPVEEERLATNSLPNGNAIILANNSVASAPDNLAMDSAGYLEPITHLQPTSTARNSGLISPGCYICLHGQGLHSVDWPVRQSSVTSCCKLSNGNSNHHYVNKDVVAPASFSNGLCLVHQYVNSSVVVENTYANTDAMMTLSPAILQESVDVPVVDVNTNYAKLDELLKQEQESAKRHNKDNHYYVNVKPEAVPGKSSPTLATKLSHRYVNISNSCGEVETDEVQVNYAVLDLDQTKVLESSVVANSGVASPTTNQNGSVAHSPSKSPEGYAQIDFDKTVALSNSANPCPTFNDDSIRKTRHNASTPCGSMSA